MTAPRAMSIAYGLVAIPGVTAAGSLLHLTGIHRLFRGKDEAECTFRFEQAAVEGLHEVGVGVVAGGDQVAVGVGP